MKIKVHPHVAERLDGLRKTDLRLQFYRASGPGGQHRNKTATACRITHLATGLSAEATDSRSQADNRRNALRRLRMNIACQVRRPVDLDHLTVPEVVAECLFMPRGGPAPRRQRIQIGRKDRRFWGVAQILLDLLDARGGKLAAAAGDLDIGTSNFVSIIKSDRHLVAAAQGIRKRHGLGPMK